MRHLKFKDDSEFSLIKFIGDNIPRYAILSHTWGADGEEITFKDLMKGTRLGNDPIRIDPGSILDRIIKDRKNRSESSQNRFLIS
jgi:hypothetical protein